MWERVSSWVQRNRRRLAGLVLVLFVLTVFVDLSRTVPRETRLALDLGEGHAEVREVVVEVSEEGELVEYGVQRYPEGAPSRVTDTIDLVPGHYAVRLGLTYADGRRAEREGEFDAPAEGVVIVSWQP